MARKGFFFDMTTCIGCRTCQVACKDKNNLEVGVLFRHVRSFESGNFPKPGFYHFSGTCNHCEQPKCVEGCPTGAMHIGEDGTVQHDDKICIGCKYCIWNCPYGNPQYIEESGVVRKCDSCKDLRDAGENPACVDACIMRCLKFGELDELAAKYGAGLVKELPILPLENITKPSLLVKPKASAYNPKYKETEV